MKHPKVTNFKNSFNDFFFFTTIDITSPVVDFLHTDLQLQHIELYIWPNLRKTLHFNQNSKTLLNLSLIFTELHLNSSTEKLSQWQMSANLK